MWYQMNSCRNYLLGPLGQTCDGDDVKSNGKGGILKDNEFSFHKDRTLDLPNGKMLVCTWNDPKNKLIINCQIQEIDSSDGNNEEDRNNNPTTSPSEKAVIKGTITIDSPAGVQVLIAQAACGRGDSCPRKSTAKRQGSSNKYDYSFQAKLNETYTLRGYLQNF